MPLQKDASGRIFVECINPECKKIHLLKRNRDYQAKPQLRFRCTACETKWNATGAEQEQIIEAYSKPPEKKQKAQPKAEQTWLDKLGGMFG